jgi:hypothetical protein
MLHARLQTIEHDLNVSQKMLLSAAEATSVNNTTMPVDHQKSVTSVVPQLFATRGVSLETTLLEPAQVKIAVGGVDVSGVVPWLQRLLIARRTLEFTYYETPNSVIVSGTLQPMGLNSEGLRIVVPKENGKPANLDEVASVVATEIERQRLARDQTNRVEALSTGEFGKLVNAINEAARLSRQAALGRPALDQFAALLSGLEPLAQEVRDWYQLQILIGGIAVSANKPDRAVAHFTSALDTLQAQINRGGALAQPELTQQVAALKGKLDELQPKSSQLIAEADAYNTLFGITLAPLPVKLLPADNANAYTDGTTFSAPRAVAQLPEVTWHNMSWIYIDKYLPVFSRPAQLSNEANIVAYAYSDILPAVIRQEGLVTSPDPKSWDLYRGGVAWIKAAFQGQEFKLGDDLRPLRSMSNPGKAYKDPVLGDDNQISHYRDLTPTTEVHVGAGIGTKAFYETAQRLNVERAASIWIEALKKVPTTYKDLAAALMSSAGTDQSKVKEALEVVGLDGPRLATAPAGTAPAPRSHSQPPAATTSTQEKTPTKTGK